MKKRSKLVVDTGVIISAFAFGGVPAAAVRKAARNALICVSPQLLEEYREVPLRLEDQGKINHEQLKALIAGISIFVSESLLVYPSERIEIFVTQKIICYWNVVLKQRQNILLPATGISLNLIIFRSS